MLDIEEVGGDKAYDANYISRYAKEHSIDARIKVRRGPIPSYCHHGKKYRKAHMIDAASTPRASPPRRTGATTPRPATTPSRPSSVTKSTARTRKSNSARSSACASPTA